MNSVPAASVPDADQLANRLDDESAAVMREVWPREEAWSIRTAADRLGARELFAEFQSRIELLRTAQQTTAAPIVGVVGSLNGGKSSLVAALLSDKSAARVLVGEADSAGTHRFVFWLPESWHTESAVFGAFEQQISAAFGPSHEFLEAEPEAAARQYNDREKMGVPLVAFDPRLDDLGLALLDTPDIETGAGSEEEALTAKAREAFVAGASKICSGVVLIIRRSEVRAEVFTNLIQVLRGELASLPRYLLINMVRPSEGVDALRQDCEVQARMSEMGVEKLFAAYHFEMGRAEELIPFEAAQEEGVDGHRSPVFFEIAEEPAGNETKAIGRDRLIHREVRELHAAGLWEQALDDRWQRLVECQAKLRGALSEAAKVRREAVLTAHSQLHAFLRSVLVSVDNRLNIPFTPHTARQLADSLVATAPWYARPALWTFSHVRKLQEAVRETVQTGKRVRQLAHPDDAVKEEAAKLKKQLFQQKGESVFDPTDLARRSRQTRFIPLETEDEALEEAWAVVQQTVEARTRDLPQDELNEAMRVIWEEVPGWKKALLGVSGPIVLTTALLAFCLAMVDFGGSTILWAASVKELLACLGLGGAAAAIGGHSLDEVLKRRLALPAYQHALAAACDVFGLPRTPTGPIEEEFEGIPKRELDLETPPKLETRLPVVPEALWVEERPEGWEAFFKHE